MAKQQPDVDVGVIFIHGIGNQSHGSVIREMAQPVSDAVVELVDPTWAASVTSDDELIRIELSPKGSGRDRCIELHEAIWSDCFPRPNGRTMATWLAVRLPFLALALAPDSRDRKAIQAVIEDDTSSNGLLSRTFRPLAQAAVVAPMMARMLLRLFTLAALFMVCVAVWVLNPWVGAVSTLGLLLVVFALLRSPKLNILGHVKVATADGPAKSLMLQRVSEEVDRVCRGSRRVCVVGHSQGGYLAHEVLSQKRRSRVVTLFGVGSGLRPIHILEHVGSRDGVVLAWLMSIAALIGTTTLAAGLTLGSGPWIEWTKATIVLLSLVWVAPATLPNVVAESLRLLPHDIGVFDLLPGFQWSINAGIGFALYVILLVAARWVGRRQQLDLRIADLPRTEWHEVTTPHDTVGRLEFPELPANAVHHRASCGGNALMDHLWYFERHSAVRYLIAEALLRRARVPQRDVPATQLLRHLSRLANRRRGLSTWLIMSTAGVMAFAWALNGHTFAEAFITAAVPMAVASLTVGGVMVWRERSSQKVLIGRIVSGDQQIPETVGYPDRRTPAALAWLLTASCLPMILIASWLPPGPTQESPAVMLWLSTAEAAWVVGAAVHLGYRVPSAILPLATIFTGLFQWQTPCSAEGVWSMLTVCPGRWASLIAALLGILTGMFMARQSPVFSFGPKTARGR